MIQIFARYYNILKIETISANLAPKFKYCQFASVDVERSISAYKNDLSDQQHNTTAEYLVQQ